MKLPAAFERPGWLHGICEYCGIQYGVGKTPTCAESFPEAARTARLTKIPILLIMFFMLGKLKFVNYLGL